MKFTLFLTLLFLTLTGAAAQTPNPVGGPVQSTVAAQNGDRRERSVEPQKSEPTGARIHVIVSIARSLKFARPETAVGLVPANVAAPDEIAAVLRKALADNPQLARQQDFCDPNFVGEPINFSQTAELTLDDLLLHIHRRFGVNFLIGHGIRELPINIRAGSIPWNQLLKSQLFLSGVRATCISSNTIQLVKNDVLPRLQDTAEVQTRFIKLRFLQPSAGGNVDVAGRSNQQSSGQGCGQGGGGGQSAGGGGAQNCGNFEKLLIEIEKILGLRPATTSSVGGGGQGSTEGTEAIRTNRSVSVIPGRNILAIRGTDEEMDLINQIITLADRPPFQVIVKGLVYTANENRLRDIGIQTNIFATTADGRTSGGISSNPISGAGTLFDFSTLIGTVEFNVQASALESRGIISIKSRPFAMVLDGDRADLDVGRQIPVLIHAFNPVGGLPGTLEILEAGNILSVTPQVIDDDGGNPIGVNLTLQLESNDVDTSVVSQGVPSVNRRSIQTRLLLNQDKTVILGGFTVDTNSRDVSKTPGLGDIPVLGYLFKRRVRREELNRLYFAISVTIVPYGSIISPVTVPGATTNIPTVPEAVPKIEKVPENKDQ